MGFKNVCTTCNVITITTINHLLLLLISYLEINVGLNSLTNFFFFL
jgi:hypothetical protein